MSTTLFVLVVLQGASLSFSPGYTTAAECMQQYKGPNVACFAYDPNLSTWTAFFKLPDGGVQGNSQDSQRRRVSAIHRRFQERYPGCLPAVGSSPTLVTLPA